MIALNSNIPSDESILNCDGEGMADMKASCDIRRGSRNHEFAFRLDIPVLGKLR